MLIPNLPPTECWTQRPRGIYARILHAELMRYGRELNLDMRNSLQFCSRQSKSWGILMSTTDGLLVQVQCGDGEKDRTLVSVARLEQGSWPAYVEQRKICSRGNMARVAGERLTAYLPEMLAGLRRREDSERIRVTVDLLAMFCWRLMERGSLAPSKVHRALLDLREHVGMDLTHGQIAHLVSCASVRESASRSIFHWPEVGSAASDVVATEVENLAVRTVRHDVR